MYARAVAETPPVISNMTPRSHVIRETTPELRIRMRGRIRK